MFLLLFCTTAPPPAARGPEPGAPQLLLALALHRRAERSHVHIAAALDFVTRVTAAC